MRGTTTFVLPEEDVEVKVGQVFRRLSGPVLAADCATVADPKGIKTEYPQQLDRPDYEQQISKTLDLRENPLFADQVMPALRLVIQRSHDRRAARASVW